ncbi:MAG TPA: hypothetical protein VET23_03175 [Chitinophagaceae bacterium]|nr:hypothetical protein [Chitinophagaceae bacterium]
MPPTVCPANAHGVSDTLKFNSFIEWKVENSAACYEKTLKALFFSPDFFQRRSIITNGEKKAPEQSFSKGGIE